MLTTLAILDAVTIVLLLAVVRPRWAFVLAMTPLAIGVIVSAAIVFPVALAARAVLRLRTGWARR